MMITLHISAEVKEDRQVVLTLPPDVPLGKAEMVVTITPQTNGPAKRPGTSLADWAERHAEDWGDQLSSEDVEGFTGRRF
jgi:hypothetical protein